MKKGSHGQRLSGFVESELLSQDSEGLRDFRMLSDGKNSAFSLMVVGFLVN